MHGVAAHPGAGGCAAAALNSTHTWNRHPSDGQCAWQRLGQCCRRCQWKRREWKRRKWCWQRHRHRQRCWVVCSRARHSCNRAVAQGSRRGQMRLLKQRAKCPVHTRTASFHLRWRTSPCRSVATACRTPRASARTSSSCVPRAAGACARPPPPNQRRGLSGSCPGATASSPCGRRR